MPYAILTTYEVTELDFISIKAFFSNYVFNRKAKGKYFVKLSTEQLSLIEEHKLNINLIKSSS